MTEKRNIFVVGDDRFNLDLLQLIHNADSYRFHRLLTYKEVVQPNEFDADEILRTAMKRLDDFDGPVDGIIGYWDFPTSTILPVLRARFDLAGPTEEAVLKCEHKYWSRVEQAKAFPDHTPKFCAFNPFAKDVRGQIDLDYPFWIKPVQAHSSFLCFKVKDDRELAQAVTRIRAEIGIISDAVNALLKYAELPPEIEKVDGNHFIAEESISADRQCTLEGYVLDGEPVTYGVIDSVRGGKHSSSLTQYRYPSLMPQAITERMAEFASGMVKQIDLKWTPFNAEFFYDEENDRIHLLEINPRLSKSHSPLFLFVNGASHQQVAVEISLGEEPSLPRGDGPFRYAGKFMVRHLGGDAYVRRVPSVEETKQLCEDFPELRMQVHVQEGMRLSDLKLQESYSYELAEVFLGADSPEALTERYEELLRQLPIELDEIDESERKKA